MAAGGEWRIREVIKVSDSIARVRRRGDKRYENRFAALKAAGEGAFVPFAVLGDPDPEASLAVLKAFAAGGADMLELGLAFSDPIADGPAIQGADLRALRAGVDPAAAFEILAAFRREEPSIPIGLLVYANLVRRPGPDAFYARAARAGADSVLVADLPWEEAAPFRRAASAAGIGAVFMATPLTADSRLDRIVKAGGPYLYVVSRTGVTGKDASLAASAAPLLARIKRRSAIPTLLGFGVGRPDQVRQALSAGADGAISGSAVAEIVARQAAGKRLPLAASARRELAAKVQQFTHSMKGATR